MVLAIELPAPIRVPVTLGPNVRGSIAIGYGEYGSVYGGAFYGGDAVCNMQHVDKINGSLFTGFAADVYNSVYKDSITTVQPLSTQFFIMIKN